MTIDAPLTAPEDLDQLWTRGDLEGVLDRLTGDLEILHALCRYGVIHRRVRSRPEEEWHETVDVAWNLGKEPTLWEALDARKPFQIAVRPADPLHPEAWLRPFQPVACSHGRIEGTWLDTGRPARERVLKVAAFRAE